LDRERNLKSELNLYDTLLEKEYQAKENADPQKLKSLESRFFDLKTQYNDLIDYFEDNYQKYYDLKYNPQPVTAQDIQKSMDLDTAFIEYFVGKYTMNIFVLTNEELEVVSLPVDEQFNRSVEAFLISIKKIVEYDFMVLSRQLYEKLINPIRLVIRDRKKLIVVPHGRLFYIPFEALISGNRRGKDLSGADYMIKQYAFSYHYSAWLWLHSAVAMAENRPKSFIGFAPVFGGDIGEKILPDQSRDIVIGGVRFPRLPGTEMEVRAIMNLFKSKRKQAKGHFHDDASEEHFKDLEMKDYCIIHVATHSLKTENNPKLSGLIFAQPKDSSRREDGILYSGETYNLNLNAELIVLSSCESGIGKLVKGEGMIALNRGFLYSGIQNTIFSLWKVDDKTTSRLMIELYRNILAGKDYASALQRAKLKLIRDRFTAFPRYWSSFILVGH
jgi:CHAT domain-containing protein